MPTGAARSRHGRELRSLPDVATYKRTRTVAAQLLEPASIVLVQVHAGSGNGRSLRDLAKPAVREHVQREALEERGEPLLLRTVPVQG